MRVAGAQNVGLLKHRKAAVIGTLLLLWLGVMAERGHRELLTLPWDAVTVFGWAFGIFVLICIVLRSPLRLDRIVFGIAAVAYLLMALGWVPFLSALWPIIRATRAFFLFLAAFICLVVALTGFETVPMDESKSE